MRVRKEIAVTGDELTIPLPPEFKGSKTVVVTIERTGSEYKESYDAEMKRAAQDPGFMADLNQVMEDFKFIDSQDIDE